MAAVMVEMIQMIWVLFPATTHLLTTVCNFHSRGSSAFFCHLWTPEMYAMHRHTCSQDIHIHKIIKEYFKNVR